MTPAETIEQHLALQKLLIQVGVIVQAWNTTGYDKTNFLREMANLERRYRAYIKDQP